MFLVKITAVLIVVYFWYKARVKNHVGSLTGFDKLRFSKRDFTAQEKRMLLIMGTFRILMYLAISITLLHFVFTHF